MDKTAVQGLAELQDALNAAVMYLQAVRETRWANRLKQVQATLDTDPVAGVAKVLGAFRGNDGFDRLYLSGARNGHNVSERQEIEANGKLGVIRSDILALAQGTHQSLVRA